MSPTPEISFLSARNTLPEMGMMFTFTALFVARNLSRDLKDFVVIWREVLGITFIAKEILFKPQKTGSALFNNLAKGFITPMTERDKCATLAVGNDTNNLTVMAV